MDKFITKSASTESLPTKRAAEDDLHWQEPKRPATPRMFTLKQSILKVSNSFNTLQVDEQSHKSPQAFRNATKKPSKIGQIPPIIIDIQPEWTHETIRNLISEFTKQFHLKYRMKNKVAVYCHDSTSHQALKVGLQSKATFQICPKKTRDLPARCCNCDEQHPANYRQCPARQKYLKALNDKRNTKAAKVEKIIRDNSPRSSWAETTKANHNRVPVNIGSHSEFPPLNQNTLDNANATCNPQVKQPIQPDNPTAEILQILSAIRSIKEKFCACTSMVDKVILVLSNLGQYV